MVFFSEHAPQQMKRRGLSESTIREVVEEPDQTLADGGFRQVRQRVVPFPPGQTAYLVRVVVDVEDDLLVVVTAYRTSKIEKYGGVQ